MGTNDQCDELFGLPYANDILVEAIHQSSEQLPRVQMKSSKPWLSNQASSIISARLRANEDRDYNAVKRLTMDLKRQVKTKLASSGT